MSTASAMGVAMNKSQKACLVIDYLVEALNNEPSSSLRRASILVDIAQNPGTNAADIMNRLGLPKSVATREVEWLFDNGCIRRGGPSADGRSVPLEIWGYSRNAVDEAISYFKGNYANLKSFLEHLSKAARQEKPSLRDAKIIAFLMDRKQATKQEIMEALYDSGSTDHRSFNELVEDGVVEAA